MAAIGSGDNPSLLIGGTPRTDASPVFFLSVYDNGNVRDLCVHAGNINAVWYPVHEPLLHYAVRRNNVEVVRVLLRNGADVNLRDNVGNSPLLLHCSGSSCSEIFHLLLEGGADVNARDCFGCTALHIVRCRSVVKELLQRGADVHARNNQGKTPLVIQWTWRRDNSDITELLLLWGAEIDKGSEEVVFELVKDKACGMELYRKVFKGTGHTYIRDSEECTPLHWAVREGRADLVRLLLKYGASVEARDMFGRTPLRRGAEFKCGGEVVSELIRKRADVNTQCNAGHTPLHCAFLDRNEAVVGLLLSAGADPDVVKRVPPSHPCAPLVVKHSVLRNYASRCEYAENAPWNWKENSLTVKQCMSEIEAMKSTRLSEALSLYDVAFGDDWDISCACKVYEYISSCEYPMYSGLAMSNLALKVKKHLCDRANNNSLFMQGLSKKSSFRTDQYVLLQIVKYLSDDDCLNLYIAGC